MDYILTIKYLINVNFCLTLHCFYPEGCVVPPHGHSVDGDSSHRSLFFLFFFFFSGEPLLRWKPPF